MRGLAGNGKRAWRLVLVERSDHFVFLDHLRDDGVFRVASQLLGVVEILHLILNVYLSTQCKFLEVLPVLRVQLVAFFKKKTLHLDLSSILFDQVPSFLCLFHILSLSPLNLLPLQLLLFCLLFLKTLSNSMLL